MINAIFPQDTEKVRLWLESSRAELMTEQFEDKRWKEWWCILEEYERRSRLCGVSPRMQVQHLGDEQGQPDLRIVEDDVPFPVEITEATVPEDRRAIKAKRGADRFHLLGEPVVSHVEGREIPGGRFRGGVLGDAWEQALVGDVLAAIERKSGKPYARQARLIVYPNSNATFACPSKAFQLLSKRRIAQPFPLISILWPGNTLVQIDAEDAHYFEGQNDEN